MGNVISNDNFSAPKKNEKNFRKNNNNSKSVKSKLTTVEIVCTVNNGQKKCKTTVTQKQNDRNLNKFLNAIDNDKFNLYLKK